MARIYAEQCSNVSRSTVGRNIGQEKNTSHESPVTINKSHDVKSLSNENNRVSHDSVTCDLEFLLIGLNSYSQISVPEIWKFGSKFDLLLAHWNKCYGIQ